MLCESWDYSPYKASKEFDGVRLPWWQVFSKAGFFAISSIASILLSTWSLAKSSKVFPLSLPTPGLIAFLETNYDSRREEISLFRVGEAASDIKAIGKLGLLFFGYSRSSSGTATLISNSGTNSGSSYLK